MNEIGTESIDIEKQISDLDTMFHNVFDNEKYPYLDDVNEITYIYKRIQLDNGEMYFFNKSLFGNFLDFDLEGSIEHMDDTEKKEFLGNIGVIVTEKFQESISELLNNINILEADIQNITEHKGLAKDSYIQANFLLEAIRYKKMALLLAENGSVFEGEKIGADFGMSQQEVTNRVQYNKELEENLFGKQVVEIEQEVLGNLRYLNKQIKNKSISSLNKLYDSLVNKFSEKGYDLSKLEQKEVTSDADISKNNNLDIIKKFYEKYGDIKIKKEEFKKIFELVFKMFGFDDIEVIVDSDVSSVYDSPKALYIPIADQEMSLKRLIKLISHEISVHYVTQYNHYKNTGSTVRGAGNLFKEEGVATIKDRLVTGADISIDENFTYRSFVTFIGEQLGGKDFINVLEELKTKEGVGSDVTATLLRAKRNYPFYAPGVQHKDLTYPRGRIQFFDFLFNGCDITRVLTGKFSYDDIMAGNDKIVTKHAEPEMPIMMAEMLMFFLISKDKDLNPNKEFKFVQSDFEDFMKILYNNRIEQRPNLLEGLEITPIDKTKLRYLVQIKNIIQPAINDQILEKVS